MIALLGHVLAGTASAVLVYFVVVNSFQTLLLVSAAGQVVRHRRLVWGEERTHLLSSSLAPRVSVLAPAYNEQATVVDSVLALLTLSYPDLEVVLVNDGSSDATMETLQEHFALTPVHPIHRHRLDTKPVRGLWRSASSPDLVVVDKENGGKADALNVALNVANGELVLAIDADTLVEPDALLRIVRPFLRDDDVVAAGGTIRVANGCQVRGGRVVHARVPRRLLAGVQCVEYLRAFLFGRLGWNRLGGNLVISGAFGLFRHDAVIAAGGYVHDSVGEDMELVANIRRRGREQGGPHKVAFVPDPVAWTEVPETARVLGRQRDRWQRGLADVLLRHRALLGNPRYGALGTVVSPYFLVAELLAPIVEAVGLVALVAALAMGTVDPQFAALFFLIAYGHGLLLSLGAVLLEEASDTRYPRWRDKALLLLWAVVENFGYRQLTVAWRLQGMIKYLRRRTDWGTMERRGFDNVAPDTPPGARDSTWSRSSIPASRCPGMRQ